MDRWTGRGRQRGKERVGEGRERQGAAGRQAVAAGSRGRRCPRAQPLRHERAPCSLAARRGRCWGRAPPGGPACPAAGHGCSRRHSPPRPTLKPAGSRAVVSVFAADGQGCQPPVPEDGPNYRFAPKIHATLPGLLGAIRAAAGCGGVAAATADAGARAMTRSTPAPPCQPHASVPVGGCPFGNF